jgi:sirohydrochlorin ferrochelatase
LWESVPIGDDEIDGRRSMNNEKNSKTAALLIAHGSRRASANADLVQLAQMLKEANRYEIVEIAYLELVPPSIVDEGRACVADGATRVLLLPYFLSAGAHVVNDLERFRVELAREFPEVEFHLCAPLGLHPKMLDIVLDRLDEGNGP